MTLEKAEEITTLFSSSLGIVSSLIIIIIFIYFKEYRLFYRKLVFILSIYDFFQSLSFLLPGKSNQTVCKIQALMTIIFGTIPSFWSAVISLVSYFKIVKEFTDQRLNKIQNLIHLFVLIPVVILVAVHLSFYDVNSSKTYWCSTENQVVLITFYLFVWIYGITCLVFYIITIVQLKRLFKLVSKGYYSANISQPNQFWIQVRMSLIPLVEFIVIIPATIGRLRDIINPSCSDIPTLDILHSILSISQGFWDFLIFIVFDPEIRKKIRDCCSSNQFEKYDSGFDIQSYQSKMQADLFIDDELDHKI
ncbi:g protein-coupled receptor [Anaeramoeba ignava]|uniref:G protein-coupled receptor n=1 Tax=Anaeramoeba ignava TaxID=1746090 RepID=A0A9Q0LVW6_ANAIG|nr:g protein-coupled receptor [Anaeramoeba ignava]